MERDDILNRIDEQEQWAASALSGIQESSLFTAPVTSDAQFLVSVRSRIEKARGLVTYQPHFLTFRRLVGAASVCVVLLVAVIVGGRFTRPFEGGMSDMAGQTIESDSTGLQDNTLSEVAGMPTDEVVDSMADANVDPVELAQYLDVPDYVEEDVADTSEDLPLTDQLLTLDTRTLEEVLTNLEDTEFF